MRRDRPARLPAGRLGARRRRRRARALRARPRPRPWPRGWRSSSRSRRSTSASAAAGIAVLERLVTACRDGGALVLLDVKRGDIGSTSQAYADAYLDPSSPLAVDAITASPYLGFGSLTPMIDTARRHGRGVFVLALTSNKEGPEVQEARTGDGTVADVVLDHLRELNRDADAARRLRSRGRRHHRRRRPPARHQRPDPRPGVRRAGRHACRPAPHLRGARPATSCPARRASSSVPGPTDWPTRPTGSTTSCASCSDDPSPPGRRRAGRAPPAAGGVRRRPELLRRGPGPPVRARLDRPGRRPDGPDPGAARSSRTWPARRPPTSPPTGSCWWPGSPPCRPRWTTPASTPRRTTRVSRRRVSAPRTARLIRTAAAQLAAADTQQALATVQQEVLDVCHTPLEL